MVTVMIDMIDIAIVDMIVDMIIETIDIVVIKDQDHQRREDGNLKQIVYHNLI
jgi:hypothetical protein